MIIAVQRTKHRALTVLAPGRHDDTIAGPTHEEFVITHAPTSTVDAAVENPLSPEWQTEIPVLCVAGRGPLDEAASAMLAQLLEKHNTRVRVVPYEAVSRARIGTLNAADVTVVCIPYLGIRGGSTHLRFLIRRIRKQLPAASILAKHI